MNRYRAFLDAIEDCQSSPIPQPPATCDECGKHAWCRLTSWRDKGHVIGKFLCDACRALIPNEDRGWGKDARPKEGNGDG